METYYNDNDPKVCLWLAELAKAGLVTHGTIDSRSIAEIKPGDIAGYERVHLFAGIGGWDYALKLAGWPADRPVWTGSCPCQPFSAAGKGEGGRDKRDLWPEFYRLVRECRPECVFGEQVANAIGFGWLDRVCADMEKEGYSIGACVLGAHSVGAPHIRQRLYWVAQSESAERRAEYRIDRGSQGWAGPRRGGHIDGLAQSDGGDSKAEWLQRGGKQRQQQEDGGVGGVADSNRRRHKTGWSEGGSKIGNTGNENLRPKTQKFCDADGVANANGVGSLDDQQSEAGRETKSTDQHRSDDGVALTQGPEARPGDDLCQGQSNPWSDSQTILCRDGKQRRIPIEPAFQPLAHGLPGRVAQLRGLGNAIVPQVAATFIRAFLEVEQA